MGWAGWGVGLLLDWLGAIDSRMDGWMAVRDSNLSLDKSPALNSLYECDNRGRGLLAFLSQWCKVLFSFITVRSCNHSIFQFERYPLTRTRSQSPLASHSRFLVQQCAPDCSPKVAAIQIAQSEVICVSQEARGTNFKLPPHLYHLVSVHPEASSNPVKPSEAKHSPTRPSHLLKHTRVLSKMSDTIIHFLLYLFFALVTLSRTIRQAISNGHTYEQTMQNLRIDLPYVVACAPAFVLCYVITIAVKRAVGEENMGLSMMRWL